MKSCVHVLTTICLWALSTATAIARPDGFARVVEDGTSIRLEMAVREYAPKERNGPKIYLAAAVHIGEEDFYRQLQQFLDKQDIVLFEGVKPPGAGAAEHDAADRSDAQRIAVTKRRIRFIAMAIDRYQAEHKKLPASFEQLEAGSKGRIATLLHGAHRDGWDRDLQLATIEQEDGELGFDIVSLGADGQPGGEGPAADIRFRDQPALSKSERGDRSGGIQAKMAEATGLVFQLNAMHHDGPNWRNSDLSIDQVQERLDKSGADAGALFSMLDGSSFMSRIGSALLGLIGSNPEGKAMLRLMLIEMLGHAGDLIKQAPGGMGKLMDVILEDRNQVVLADLKRIVDTEKDIRTIGVIYGAGHLPGLEAGILALGYQPAGDTWFTAMRASAQDAGLTEARFKATRDMVSRMVEAQVKRAK